MARGILRGWIAGIALPLLVAAPAAGAGPAGGTPLAYELPQDGTVTLVIEDAAGWRVRTLAQGLPRHAGPNLERWDGRDDSGEPAAPGRYRWRGIFAPPLEARYLLHLFPTANPPWPAPGGSSGGWGSDLAAPSAVCASGRRVFLLAPAAASGAALLACDLGGNKIWGRAGGGLVCAADGSVLCYADATDLARLDAATGEPLPFASGSERLPHGFAAERPPTAMAVCGERLYVGSAAANAVRVFDLSSGAPVRDLTLPAPGGLALDAQGRLLAVSSNSIVRLDPDTGATTPVVDGGLRQPRGLAVAPNGNLFVIERATHQVRVFRPDGRPLRALGIEGGRAAIGEWQRDALRDPAGLGLDGEGNVWIAEADPVARRLSRWDPRGVSIGQWLGPSLPGGEGIVDHRERSRVYCGGLEFEVDWDTGTSRPIWTHLRGPDEGQPAVAGTLAAGGRRGRQGFTVTVGDHDYLCFDLGLICIRRGPCWIPAAAVGGVRTPDDARVWSDRNEDGRVQDEEVWEPDARGWNDPDGWGVPWARSDLSTVRPAGGDALLRFTPLEFTGGGVPVFGSGSVSTTRLAAAGAAVSVADVDEDLVVMLPAAAERQGVAGYHRNGRLRWLAPAGPDPRAREGGGAPANARTDPPLVLGVAGPVAGVGSLFCFRGAGGRRILFTADGLFVGALFRPEASAATLPPRAQPGMSLAELAPGREGGGTFGLNRNGDFYLTAGFGGAMCLVARVEGLGGVRRLEGAAFDLLPEPVRPAASE